MSKYNSWVDAYKQIVKIADDTPVEPGFEKKIADAVDKFYADNMDDINVKRARDIFYDVNESINRQNMNTSNTKGIYESISYKDVFNDVKNYIEDLIFNTVEDNLVNVISRDVKSYNEYDDEHDVVNNLPSNFFENSTFQRKLDAARQKYVEILAQALFITEDQYYDFN